MVIKQGHFASPRRLGGVLLHKRQGEIVVNSVQEPVGMTQKPPGLHYNGYQLYRLP
jgi:hypothetical protein